MNHQRHPIPVLAMAFIAAVKLLLDEIRRMSTLTYVILFVLAVLIILVPMEIR